MRTSICILDRRLIITVIKLCFSGKWGGRISSLRELAENIYLISSSFIVFENPLPYLRALLHKSEATSILKTRTGLRITFRQNLYDARILRESFLEKPYLVGVQNFDVILDIGAYIGDFSLYAAKHLGARVIAFEPTAENFSLLAQNVRNNNLSNRISISPLAVSARGGPLQLFIQSSEAGEIHASSNIYGTHYVNPSTRVIESISINQILVDHNLAKVNLLKLDIEGGEYDILEDMSDEVFEKIDNIVLECHPIPGYEPRLRLIMVRLSSLNYKVKRKGWLVWANKQCVGASRLRAS